MVKKRLKKYTAFIIAAALICGLPVPVSAEDASRERGPDISQLTADVETDLYQVVMPTDTDGIFDFILDPQGLINETDGALHEGKSFEKNCTVFFKRSDGGAKEDYSCKSDPVTITNKSTMPVEVSLEVKVKPSSLEGIKMTEDSKFKKDKSASLYLAVIDGKKEMPVGKDGVTLHKTIGAAPDGAYGYEYNSDTKKYEYGLKKNIEENIFDKYSFQLIGAANKKGDWAAFTKAVPKILVTWKVLPKENDVLRKDAIFVGEGLESEQGDLEPEDKKEKDQEGKQPDREDKQPGQEDKQQLGQEDKHPTPEEESRADTDSDDNAAEQEQPEVADEDEKSMETSNDESKEKLADQNGSEEDEKTDKDTEVLAGE